MMKIQTPRFLMSAIITGAVVAMATLSWAEDPPVDTGSAVPGGMVMVKDASVQLYGSPVGIGDDFLQIVAATDIDFPFKDKVTIVSIVPSLDTPVCEFQTYKLSTMKVPEGIDVITISRDLPMAQERFAREHDMSSAGFVSDYKSGAFGKSTGLMMEGKELLARGVLVLDAEGVVRYIQVVPQVTHLPDLDHALAKARELTNN